MTLAEFLQYIYQLEHIVEAEEPECRLARVAEMCQEIMTTLLAHHTSSDEAKNRIVFLFDAVVASA